MQWQQRGVRVVVAREVQQAQLAALFGGKRLRFEGPVAMFQPAVALVAACLLRGDLGWGRGRAQEDGAVLNLFDVDAVSRGGGVGAGEKRLGDGRLSRCHVRIHTGLN